MYKVCPASNSAVTLRSFVTPRRQSALYLLLEGFSIFCEGERGKIENYDFILKPLTRQKFGLYIVEDIRPKYRWRAPPLYANETLEAPSDRATYVHMIRRLAAGYNCYNNYRSVSGFLLVSYVLLESMSINCYKDGAGGLPFSQSLTPSTRDDFFAWYIIYIQFL